MIRLFRDDQGVTTAGMAVSLFLCVALIFSGAQLYRIHSACAEVQEVADVCALAAENEVAGFQTVADTCDAACLSMTLLAVCLYGLGLVAACVPPVEGVSVKLLDMAHKIVDLRRTFYERACSGLNAAQRALPFIAACNASQVARANNNGSLPADYAAAAVLVPADFTKLGQAVDDGLSDTSAEIDAEAQAIRDKASEAEEAARKANDAKERGFQEDCGADPAYCMRERAASLAKLPDGENPSFSSIDAWSFGIALDRARAYYRMRLSIWRLEGSSVEAQADAIIRKRFYEYASEQLEDAYVHEGPDGFSAFLPHLFRNTNEFRTTPLYTEKAYPVTVNGGRQTMHAWGGCPQANGAGRNGSVSELEEARASFVSCPLCKFIPSSVGNVAAASTSIKNGFENHYEAVRKACEEYAEARAQADPLAAEVKDKVKPLLEALSQVLENAGAFRIHAEPPGRSGALALVVNAAENSADAGFANSFVNGGVSVGTRVAVSAAALATDDTEAAGAAATETLRSLLPDIGGIGPAASTITGVWMSALHAYADGQSALEDAVQRGLSSFSQTSASGLGAWAAKALSGIIKAAGLEPANTKCRKPCVLNTRHVAQADDSQVCVSFLRAKDAALAGSSPSPSALGMLFAGAGNAFSAEGAEGGAFMIAQIQLPFGAERIIQWVIPEVESSAGLLDHAAGVLGSMGIPGAERAWQ